jgi:hypothetical protein
MPVRKFLSDATSINRIVTALTIVILSPSIVLSASPSSDKATSSQNQYRASDTFLSGKKEIQVAQAAEKKDTAQAQKCFELAKDIDADVGAIIKAGCQPSTAQMSKLMDNPLGNVAMLFSQYDFTRLENGDNGKTANKHQYMGIAQFPKKLSEDWNLINRVIWTVPSMPLDQGKIDKAGSQFGNHPDAVLPDSSEMAPIDVFDGRETGLGDSYYVALFSPSEGIKVNDDANFVWGVGFDVGFPTATEDLLGTGKWTGGPSALGVYMGPKWKAGALVTQYWDFAGDDDRDDVNMTNLQYFIFYSLSDTLAVGASPNIIANWEQDSDNAFTVPVGIGLVKTFQFGKLPVRIGGELHYSAVQPDDTVGAEWNFRFYVIPAAPSALFGWMN